MIGFLFRPGSSFLHRFDPRCKLLLCLLLTVLLFLPTRLPALGACLILPALAILLALGFRELARPLRTIAPLLLLILLLTPPFHRSGQAYLRIGGITLLSADGVLEALRLIVRFGGITLCFYALLRSTDPEELILAMRAFGLPFAAGLVLSIALQYIPSLQGLYDQVRDAHRLRQAESRQAAPKGLRAVRGMLPLLTSVLILAVRRIPVLAMALELRGVGRKNRRSSMRALPGGRRLAASAAAAAAAGLAAVAMAFLFP
jgi:energy-coupling factor transport system permease protein